MTSRDERGAMMVIGVFMATFLVGVLYYLIGTAEAVFFREGMQDAADAAALGAAISHARGMNFIALVNILMAALVMILLALKLLETVIIILMGVVTAIAATGFGAIISGSLLPALEGARSAVNAANEAAKGVIFPLLRGMSQVSNAVRVSTPAVAELLTISDVVNGRDPADFGFMLPARMTLPVEKDQFSVLCAHAGENLAELATLPLSPIPGISVVRDTLESAMGQLSGSLSAYFCGKPGAPPPSASVPVKRGYPLTDLGNQCVKDNESGKNESEACRDAQQERDRATPGPFGDCKNSCKPGELFDTWTSLARQQCNSEEIPRIHSWKWQQMWIIEELTWSESAKAWQSSKVEQTDERVLSGNSSPCGGINAEQGWNTKRHPDGPDEDTTKVLPICSSEILDPPVFYPHSQVFKRRYQTVTDIFGCLRTVTANYKMEGAEPAKTNGEEVPWKIQKDILLGQNDFQIRAVALGGTGDLRSAAGVRIATWVDCSIPTNRFRRECQSGSLFAGAADLLGRMSVAQAEYYFEGDMKREEWMWNMNWRARLKRFRLPDVKAANKKRDPSDAEAKQFGGQKEPNSSEDACGRAKDSKGGRCGGMTSTLETLSSVIKH